MKLITQQIAKTTLFRKRTEDVLASVAAKWIFKSANDSSVDKQDRVTNVEFLSVPQIDDIIAAGDEQAQIRGSIGMELTVETQIHGQEGEKTVSEIRRCRGQFLIDATGPVRTSATLTDKEIHKLRIKLRSFSL